MLSGNSILADCSVGTAGCRSTYATTSQLVAAQLAAQIDGSLGIAAKLPVAQQQAISAATVPLLVLRRCQRINAAE
jgi:hypothetical protein